jgi:hypothetical protein
MHDVTAMLDTVRAKGAVVDVSGISYATERGKGFRSVEANGHERPDRRLQRPRELGRQRHMHDPLGAVLFAYGVVVIEDRGHPAIGSDELHMREVESISGGFLKSFFGHPLPKSVATIRLQHADAELDQRFGDTGEVHDAAQHKVGVAPAQYCIAVKVQRTHVIDYGFIPAGNAKAQMACFRLEGKKMALHEVALIGIEPTGLAQRRETRERHIHDASTLLGLSQRVKQDPHHFPFTPTALVQLPRP